MKFIFWPLIGGYPQTRLKLGGKATQTSVVAILHMQYTI